MRPYSSDNENQNKGKKTPTKKTSGNERNKTPTRSKKFQSPRMPSKSCKLCGNLLKGRKVNYNNFSIHLITV